MQSYEQLTDWVQLINSENIGPVTFYKLLDIYKDAATALAELPKFPKYTIYPRDLAKREVEKAQKSKIEIITRLSPFYPESLKHIEDAPPVLYLAGNPHLLQNPLSLSIVGARNASINGRKTASKIAYDLTNSGILIISGMARGIDSAAHKGAMYANNQQGATLAVLGTGVDVIYPSENKALYQQILQNGAIISEFPLGSEAQSSNFPRRNRIVSALSMGTLVVEATLHSGSLITARLALEQGKDIFAIPGSPQDARALGPNKLIKDGATLVENADDILQALQLNNQKQIIQYVDKLQKNADIPQMSLPDMASADVKTPLLDYINREGVYVDELIRTSGLNASEVSLELLELELSGRIERQTGNKVALIK